MTGALEAQSATHAHLLSLAAREAVRRCAEGRTVRLLDIGCGDGRLLAYLALALPPLLGGRRLELHGFDIAGHGSQHGDILNEARDRMNAVAPDVDWSARILRIREGESWPFEAGSMDLALSNQVLEHVRDGGHFFCELARVLRSGGASAHLFPSRHVLIEPHLGALFAHRAGSIDLSRALIGLSARWGASGYRRWKAAQQGENDGVERYARLHADYLHRFTWYRSLGELHALGKDAGLQTSFSDTPLYPVHAFCRWIGWQPPNPASRPVMHALLCAALRHLTSVTLLAARDAEPVA